MTQQARPRTIRLTDLLDDGLVEATAAHEAYRTGQRLNRRVSSDEARSIAAVAKAPQTKERAIDGARAAKGDGLTLKDRFDQLLEMVIAINDDLAEAGIATTRADRASRALARQPRRNQ